MLPSDAEVMAKAGAENFPVASLALPRRVRRHLLAIYGFARLADDIGDEMPGDRWALLAWLDDEVGRVFQGTPEHPTTRRLATTVRELELPEEPFRQLVEANRRDQLVTCYETYEELLEYCALSANPVGRLVLEVFGVATDERRTWSDSVCTGLQLVEHLQDVSEDLDRGRVYLPREDMNRFGCTERDLRSASSPTRTALVRFEARRARALLAEGPRLVASLRGRLRLAVAAFVAGGQAALDAVERSLAGVAGVPVSRRRRDVATHLLRVLGA